MQKKTTNTISILLMLVPLAVAAGDEDKSARIAHAASAAPTYISDSATIMESDGTILREGSNGWTCLPDTMPGDNNPMCNDSTWMTMLQAVGAQAAFKAEHIGISYMLQGDKGGGVSNSDPFHADPKSAHDYVETGPHLMIIVPPEQLSGITDDPSQGGPYVMWKNTPYAHIMIPVTE